MPRGSRVRLLQRLAHTTYDKFGEATEVVYELNEVVNLPYHMARAFIRKGIAELV